MESVNIEVVVRVYTLEAEGMVLRAISVMLVKEEGIRSLMGRLAKCTTLLPNLLPMKILIFSLLFSSLLFPSLLFGFRFSSPF